VKITGGTTGFGRYWIVAPLGGDCRGKRTGIQILKHTLDVAINRKSNPETYIECCYKLEFKS
jgi:hypothetical protein